MRHECKITVLETKVFPELQEKYLANPHSGPCFTFHLNIKKGEDRLNHRPSPS